jgi:hypothetical protein
VSGTTGTITTTVSSTDIGHGESDAAEFCQHDCALSSTVNQAIHLPSQINNLELISAANDGNHQPLRRTNRNTNIVTPFEN